MQSECALQLKTGGAFCESSSVIDPALCGKHENRLKMLKFPKQGTFGAAVAVFDFSNLNRISKEGSTYDNTTQQERSNT